MAPSRSEMKFPKATGVSTTAPQREHGRSLRLAHRRLIDTGHRRGAGAHGHHVAGAQCRRADTGEHVGGPGTEDGRHHDAAPHGHVRAQPGAWRAQAEHAAAGHVHRRGHGHAVPVDRGRARRAGQRHQRGHVDAQVQPAERHLEHGGVGVVAHEPVGQRRAGSVGDA